MFTKPKSWEHKFSAVLFISVVLFASCKTRHGGNRGELPISDGAIQEVPSSQVSSSPIDPKNIQQIVIISNSEGGLGLVDNTDSNQDQTSTGTLVAETVLGVGGLGALVGVLGMKYYHSSPGTSHQGGSAAGERASKSVVAMGRTPTELNKNRARFEAQSTTPQGIRVTQEELADMFKKLRPPANSSQVKGVVDDLLKTGEDITKSPGYAQLPPAVQHNFETQLEALSEDEAKMVHVTYEVALTPIVESARGVILATENVQTRIATPEKDPSVLNAAIQQSEKDVKNLNKQRIIASPDGLLQLEKVVVNIQTDTELLLKQNPEIYLGTPLDPNLKAELKTAHQNLQKNEETVEAAFKKGETLTKAQGKAVIDAATVEVEAQKKVVERVAPDPSALVEKVEKQQTELNNVTPNNPKGVEKIHDTLPEIANDNKMLDAMRQNVQKRRPGIEGDDEDAEDWDALVNETKEGEETNAEFENAIENKDLAKEKAEAAQLLETEKRILAIQEKIIRKFLSHDSLTLERDLDRSLYVVVNGTKIPVIQEVNIKTKLTGLLPEPGKSVMYFLKSGLTPDTLRSLLALECQHNKCSVEEITDLEGKVVGFHVTGP